MVRTLLTSAQMHCDEQPDSTRRTPVSGGTFSLLDKFLPAKCGITTTFVAIADHAAVRAAITDRTKVRSPAHPLLLPCSVPTCPAPPTNCCMAQVIYTESLSNPTLVVSDIPALARIAHEQVPSPADVLLSTCPSDSCSCDSPLIL